MYSSDKQINNFERDWKSLNTAYRYSGARYTSLPISVDKFKTCNMKLLTAISITVATMLT